MRNAISGSLDRLRQIFQHAVALDVCSGLVNLSHHSLELLLLLHFFLLASLLGESLHTVWRVLGLIMMLLSVINRPPIFHFRLLNAHYLVFCASNMTLKRVCLMICSGATTLLVHVVLVVLGDYLCIRGLFWVNMIDNSTWLLSDYHVCTRTRAE